VREIEKIAVVESCRAETGPEQKIDFRVSLKKRQAAKSQFGVERSDAIRCKGNGEISMSTQENVHIVKDFFAAIGRRDKQGLLALCAEDIEWIIPGQNWPLAGTHRGHAGLADVLQKANETVETSYPEPPEFIAQGDRVVVVGFATGRIKATNKTFEDHWVFAITVRNGKLTNIREYIDTQALARASEMDASPRP
jgi:ketosteroid isomerase-like protein